MTAEFPEFPLNFEGVTGFLETKHGKIEIIDFKVNIDDDISIKCKYKNLPEAYTSETPLKYKKMLKGIIPKVQLSKMQDLDEYIPKEDIVNFSLTDKNGWELQISNLYIEIESHDALNIDAIDLQAKIGVINDSERVQLYKILECFGNQKKIDSVDDFAPNDLHDLEFIGRKLNFLKYSIGYFKLEDEYINVKRREEPLTDNLYNLLSLFLNNFVSLRFSILIGTNGMEIEVHPINKTSSNSGNIFYASFPSEFSKFLNSTYDNYVNFKDSLGLKAVFRHFIRMKEATHTEMILLMGSILMECIKYHYAKEYKNYRWDGRDFRKPSGDRYRFKELVEEVYDEFKVVDGDTEFIKYRNEIIHQGTFDVSFLDSMVILKKLDKSITHLIFNILQFNGLYHEFDNSEWITYTPP